MKLIARHLLLIAIIPLFCARLGFAQTIPDAPGQTEAQVPGEIQIAQWDGLLNQSGTDALLKLVAPVASDSKTYQVYTANGVELREALADLVTNGGVEAIGQVLSFGTPIDGGLNLQVGVFNYSGGNTRMDGLFQKSQTEVRRTPDHLGLKLDWTELSAEIISAKTKKSATLSKDAQVQFTGNLAPGDALVLMAPFTDPAGVTINQITVLESFKAYDVMMPDIRRETDCKWWCVNGPDKLRQWAGVALVWEAHAKHYINNNLPRGATQKLDDGKTVNLLGISSPSDAPFCWWDINGQPVFGSENRGRNFSGDPPAGFNVVIEARGAADLAPAESPATRPAGSDDNPLNKVFGAVLPRDPAPPNAPIRQSLNNIIPATAGQVDVGIAIGSWTELDRLQMGEDHTIDGVTYSLAKPFAGVTGDLFRLNLKQSRGSDQLITVTAVGPDGHEYVPTPLPNIVSFTHGPTNARTFSLTFQGIAAADVATFRLCQRQRQWITFQNFAHQPTTPISRDVTPQDIADAVAILTAPGTTTRP